MVQAELAEWVSSGNLRRAASSLVVDYGSDVFATCLAMVRNRTAAEDLTQDIFSDAIRGLPSFRGESAPRTWLLSIARHRCIDYLRAQKRDPWGGRLDEEESDPDRQPDHAAFGSEWFSNRDQIAHALDALSEGDRALVVLRFKNGLEYEELAEAFGLKAGTVRMRVSRALASMREALEPPRHERARAMPGGAPPPMASAPMPPRGMPAPAPLAYGAPPPSTRPPSWWQRLVAWARGADTPSAPVPTPTPPKPVADLGRSLAMNEPPSEALFARLGKLVEELA